MEQKDRKAGRMTKLYEVEMNRKGMPNFATAKEVSQRPKGHWVLVKGSNGKDYHKCSECLHTQEITGVKNYCAICGAEMCGAERREE